MALYFGIKYGFGHVIAGGTQTRLGDFLIKTMADETSLLKVVDHITGGHTEQDRKYLNGLLFNLISNSTQKFPNIYIHVGTVDCHFIQPFINELNKNNIKYKLNVQEYNEHKYLAKFYPKYLRKTLKSIDDTLINNNFYKCDEKIDFK